MIDIVAACMKDEDELEDVKHGDTFDEHDHCDDDCSHAVELLERWNEMTLKRSFTAKCIDQERADLLTLNKVHFARMKTEARDVYDEFLKIAIVELMKTIMLKMSASDLCNEVLEEWIREEKPGFPMYSLYVPNITNKQLNAMSHDDVVKNWQQQVNIH